MDTAIYRIAPLPGGVTLSMKFLLIEIAKCNEHRAAF